MKEMLKRFLALALAVVMVIGLAPAFELKAEAASSYTMVYDQSSGNFEDFWEKAYDYSNDHDDCVVTIVLRTDVIWPVGRQNIYAITDGPVR